MAEPKNPPKERVLIVCQHFWPENFRINDIAEFLTEKNCEVDVLCGIPNYPKGQFFPGYGLFRRRREQKGDITIMRALEIPRGSNTSPRILINYLSYPFFSLFHIPFLLTKKYDRILIYQLSPVLMAISGIILGKLKRTETILYVLDMWPENLFSVLDIKNKFLRSFITKVSHWHYKKVDKLMVLSEKMKTRLSEVTKKPEGKITVLPQTCEKIYEQVIHDKKLATRFKNNFTIVFTGNISPAQSFETIIGAAAILKKDGLTNIKWVIVGDGMSRKQVEADIRKQGLSDQFTFEGQHPIEEMPKYIGIADVLVGCLSKSDLLEATIPAKVMSYIASGKPMVLAMDGEVQTLVNDTIGCGLASPTEDASSLAGNIRQIYNLSEKQRQAMGARGQKYHFKHFERNLVLNKLYDFVFKKSAV